MRKSNFSLSTPIEAKWEMLREKFRNNTPVVGKVTAYNNDEKKFIVDVGGISAQMYISDMSYSVGNTELYIGKTLLFLISKINTEFGFLKLSRKKYASKLKKNQTARGIITFAEGNRVFVDVGFSSKCILPSTFSGDIEKTFSVGKCIDIVLLEDFANSRYTKASSSPWNVWKANREGLCVNEIYKLEIVDFSSDAIIVAINDIFSIPVYANSLTKEFRARWNNKGIEIGEFINVAITEIDEDNKTIKLSMIRAKQIEEARSMNSLKSCIEIGNVLEGRVVSVTKKAAKVHVMDTDVVVHINREELSIDKILDARDVVSLDEIIPIVYLGEEDNALKFSRKPLLSSKYPKELYDLSLKELLTKQNIDTNKFLGRAVKVNNDIFFFDVASTGSKQNDSSLIEGRLLQDYITAQPSIVLVNNGAIKLIENEYYQFSIALAPKELRQSLGTPFVYSTDNSISIKHVSNPYTTEIQRVLSKQDNPEANKLIARLLKEVGSQLYSEKNRLLFELLQNADDAAPSRDLNESDTSPFVQVCVDITDDGIIFRHNGCAFNFDDFRSICSAANSTKGVKKKSTGYKGIGFKSVFTNSQSVYIHSKGFRFCFDRDNEIFHQSRFDELYRRLNEFTSDKEEQKFFAKHADIREQYNGIDDIPWQIMPFEDNRVETVHNTYSSDNVVIGLLMDNNSRDEYRIAIKEVFDNPRMFLFLRNTRRLQFYDYGTSSPQTIQKEYDAEKQTVTLARYNNGTASEQYKIFTAPYIEVSDVAFEKAGIGIRIKSEITNGNYKYSFVEFSGGIDGKTVDNIPEKIASADSTSITIAFPIDNKGSITPVNLSQEDSSFYAYLPMNEHRFKFPFFVNADFVLSSSREGIQVDNRWNIFLFHQIGRLVVEAVKSVAAVFNRNYLNLLPDLLTTNHAATSTISEAFNKSYLETLNTLKFILDENKVLRSQDEIIIDKTGLSAVIGNALFRAITGSVKYLPNNNLNIQPLYRECFDQIEIAEFERVGQSLVSTESIAILNEWLHNTDTDRDAVLNFYDWLIKHQDKLDVRDIINNLEIIEVGTSFVSLSQIANEDILILSPEAYTLADLLTKLNIQCNTCDVSEHELIDFIPVSEDTDVFKALSKINLSILDRSERISLFNILKTLNGIGDVKLKEISLFNNTEGTPKPLNEMVAFREAAPAWLMPYMICEEESTDELRPYLVPIEKEFSDIIWANLDNIDIPIYEIYKIYKWSDQNYTNKLTSRCESQEDFEALLPIIGEGTQDVKKEYIRSIKRVDLNSGNRYSKDSFEYKLLRLVLDGEESPSIFAHKVFFDNKPITQLSIRDNVSCDWEENDNKKRVAFSLATILPEYADQSSTINIIKDLFEVKSGLDRLFEAKAKSNKEIYDELNTKYDLYNGAPWPLDKTDNVYQYLFHVYYTKEVRGYTSNYVKSIDLEKVNSDFIIRLMNFCFEHNLSIRTAPFTYRLKNYFVNKYFNNNYLTDGEKLLNYIEEWANSDEKKHKYLLENGVKDSHAKEIRFRRLLSENQQIDFIGELSASEINNGLSFVCSNLNLTFPLVGDNQVETFKILSEKTGLNIKRNINLDKLSSLSQEWDSTEYISWIQNRYPEIYLYDGNMPYFLDYEDKHLCQITSDKDYHYAPTSKKLYVNRNVEISPILFTIATQPGIPFDTNDYRILCMEGKVYVSKDEITAKNEEIESLKSRVEELERLLNGRSVHIGETSTGLSKKNQYAALIEAQQALKSKRPDWYFPDGFGERNDDGTPTCFTVESVQNEEGNNMEIVIKSYKKTDEKFHINPEEWEAVVKRHAKLLVYTYIKGELDIVEIPKDELVRKQSSIQISFDTTNLDEQKYPNKISEFASILRYFQQITFDFNRFHISKDAVKVKDISSKRNLNISKAEDEDI